MINCLKDLVNESLNDGIVREMGVKRPERLQQSHMGRVRQETLRRQQDLANRPQTRSYTEVSAELTKALRKIRRLDITMEKPAGSRNYYPRFPQEIVELMRELKGIDQNRFQSDFGKWRDVYPDDSNAIHFRTEGPSDYQRSHFPNGGIPSALRGVGLGFKLYRTLLKFAGYISSNPSGTTEKDKAWGSMLTYKQNPDGTPSEDDAHAIIGPNNWMAMDKGISAADKINNAERFIQGVIGFDNTKPDRFDIDDELLAILPDEVLVRFHRDYLNSLVTDQRITQERIQSILAARTEAMRREEERRERQEAEARERRERQEAEARERAAARLTRFGAVPEEDWDLGDFVVVKSYLYDTTYDSLPIRRVVARNGSQYTAVKLQDAIRIDAGDLAVGQANDTRNTSDKSTWVKVDPTRIPDLDNVNLNSAEKAYIRAFINPEEIQRREAERARETAARVEREREENAQRARETETFGPMPNTGSELKTLVQNRSRLDSIEMLKKIRGGNFAKFIVLAPPQREGFRGQFGIPVYVAVERLGRAVRSVENPSELIDNPRNIILINVVTGHVLQGPYSGLGLTAYPLEQVTEDDKLRTRPGDHYYIANHMNNWGIMAKADYTTRNTANQPFIYLRTFGGAERSTPVRLDLLRKIGEPVYL